MMWYDSLVLPVSYHVPTVNNLGEVANGHISLVSYCMLARPPAEQLIYIISILMIDTCYEHSVVGHRIGTRIQFQLK